MGGKSMATIIKRKKAYSVVYNFTDEEGKTSQKWETCHTYKDALKRKAEVENELISGTYVPPTSQTVSEFLHDFVTIYGEKKWGVSMYDASCALIANYINPVIGDLKIQSITTRVVDKYIQTLRKTHSVAARTRKPTSKYVTDKTIGKIIKLLRCAFGQAVRWELIGKNPFQNPILPKTDYKRRDIWTADIIRVALDHCTDSKLYVAINLAFACSLRMGEILGLTWNNVHITDEDIAKDDAWIYIDKELTRASARAIEMLGERDIYYTFQPLLCNTHTRLILKKPKTESSIRKIWLPKTLAYILRKWKESQDEMKNFLGDEYQDFNLVVAQPNGRPCEDRIILKDFSKLKEKAGLPNVVFHSLRHSSTTYKLKLNHGDLKATQGDTGHAETDMITKIYAHILDEDRKVNAQKFETAFYANPDLRQVQAPQEPPAVDIGSLVNQLSKSPELLQSLSQLLAAQSSSKQAC
jgi:integrase